MAERGDWQPDFVQYNAGDIVIFQGKRYRDIQPHRSQSDWPPNQTPALWEDVGPAHGDEYRPQYEKPPQQHEKPPQQPWQSAQQAPDQPPPKPTANSGYTTDSGHQVTQQDTEKKWYDLDDTKKDALIGGGLAVGLAALAGGAYYAHEKHKENEEGEKAQAWELQNWIVAARQRTEEYLNQGPRSPVTWVYSEAFTDHPDLRNRLYGSIDPSDGQPWFIIRAPHKGGLQLGKFRSGQDATIGFSHEAIAVRQFEALIADPQGVRWIRHSGRLDPNTLGARPVEGGREDDNTPLYVARAHAKEHQGLLGFGGGGREGLYPGKASPKLDKAFVTVGDKEVGVSEYEVLVYA